MTREGLKGKLVYSFLISKSPKVFVFFLQNRIFNSKLREGQLLKKNIYPYHKKIFDFLLR